MIKCLNLWIGFYYVLWVGFYFKVLGKKPNGPNPCSNGHTRVLSIF